MKRFYQYCVVGILSMFFQCSFADSAQSSSSKQGNISKISAHSKQMDGYTAYLNEMKKWKAARQCANLPLQPGSSSK